MKAEAARTATIQNRVGMTGVLPEGPMQIIPPGVFPGQDGTRQFPPDAGPSGPLAAPVARADVPQLMVDAERIFAW